MNPFSHPPPPPKDAVPAIRAFHRLDEFPWPEKNCIIFGPDGLDKFPDKFLYWKPFVLHCEDFSVTDYLQGILNFDPTGKPAAKVVFDHCSLQKTDSLLGWDIDQSDLEVMTEEFPYSYWSGYKWEPHLLKLATPRDARVWCVAWKDAPVPEVVKTHQSPFEPITFQTYDKIRVTTDFLWMLSPLVTPCGYKIPIRPTRPFGPEALRRSFSQRPTYGIVNFDRLYRIYKQSRPHEEGQAQRVVQPHHRRRHPRHHWRHAGIPLEEVPRNPVERQVMVIEKDVPTTMVRECWVGNRTFSLDGFDFEVHDD